MGSNTEKNLRDRVCPDIEDILQGVGEKIGGNSPEGKYLNMEKHVLEGARSSVEKNVPQRMGPNIEDDIPFRSHAEKSVRDRVCPEYQERE